MTLAAADREDTDRSVWIKPRITNIMVDMEKWAPNEWIENIRMCENTFRMICNDLRPVLKKKHTKLRAPITVEKRVLVALWRLATNIEFRTLAHLFGIGRSTACEVTHEVVNAINAILLPKYLTFPTGQRLDKVISGFRDSWNIPQCAGAIDGTHIPIVGPSDNHTDFYNRKSHFSMIAQAVVDDEYKFMDIFVGCPGKMHDARVFRTSKLYENGQMGRLLPDTTQNLCGVDIPVFIIGDPAYPLMPWLMKAFPGKNLSADYRYFNYRLSRARMVVEGAFGRLKGRWRCLLKRYDSDIAFVPQTVTACCTLHNICQIQNEFYNEDWQEEILQEEHNVINQEHDLVDLDEIDTNRAKMIRKALCQWVKENPE